MAACLALAAGWPAAAAARSELADEEAPYRCEGGADDGVGRLDGVATVPEGVAAALPPIEVTVQPGAEAVVAYDIGMEVISDGDVVVSERLDYQFPGQRHGIFRTIANRQRCDDRYDRVYPLTSVAAESPTGAPAGVAVEDVDGGVALRIGDPDRYVRGRHTYVLDYELAGVLTGFEDRVELYWNVVGDGWQVPLNVVEVAVGAPVAPLAVDCFSGPVGSDERCDAVAVDGTTATFGESVILPGEAMTVVVAYPPEAFDLRAPLLEERWSLARAFEASPAAVGGAVALVVAGLGGVVLLAWRTGRDHQLAGSHVDAAFAPADVEGVLVPLFDQTATPVEFAPPDRLRPAQLSVVLDESVGPRDVAATIVDLAVRGALRIVETGEGKDVGYRLEWLGGHRGELLAYEQHLVSELFGGKDHVDLDELDQQFASEQRQVVAMIYDDAVAHGWFPARPDKVRARWRGIGVLALLVSGGALVALAAWTNLAWLGVGPVLASLLLVTLAGRMPRRTPAGTGVLRRTVGFRHFIEDSEAPRARWAEQRSIFTDYLPYAIVFGCADRWARTFEPLGAEAVAVGAGWYVGTGVLSVDRLTSATSSFAATAATTLSSTPPSSGGSGFSGGGFSGGGGGGGGGGSW